MLYFDWVVLYVLSRRCFIALCVLGCSVVCFVLSVVRIAACVQCILGSGLHPVVLLAQQKILGSGVRCAHCCAFCTFVMFLVL